MPPDVTPSRAGADAGCRVRSLLEPRFGAHGRLLLGNLTSDNPQFFVSDGHEPFLVPEHHFARALTQIEKVQQRPIDLVLLWAQQRGSKSTLKTWVWAAATKVKIKGRINAKFSVQQGASPSSSTGSRCTNELSLDMSKRFS